MITPLVSYISLTGGQENVWINTSPACPQVHIWCLSDQEQLLAVLVVALLVAVVSPKERHQLQNLKQPLALSKPSEHVSMFLP